MDYPFSIQQLDDVFTLLDGRLARNQSSPIHIVVCGGAALIGMGLLSRTTTDVDIVALLDNEQNLIAPAPLPYSLLQTAKEVAEVMQLPEDWLNNEPSSDEGGLFQMGLPEGFAERLHAKQYGSHLTVYFIDRIDQIHFKLYASVDRGGYHITDLQALNPTPHELLKAAKWACTHDVSDGFRILIKRLVKELGHEEVAENI